ncbi:MAG: hypothetical protein ACFN0J_05760, partial [Segatella salivae]
GYNEEIHGGLRLESVTPVVLVHANHALTQGSLHYRLATLGYQKRNTYGVDSNYLHAKMSRMIKQDVYKHNATRLIFYYNLSQNMQ